MTNALLSNEVFAANRAIGRIALSVAAGSGGTRRERVHESGSLRARFPNTSGTALDAVIVNVAGGMTGGDRFDIGIDVGAGAQLSVTTAAAEKIYRSLGPQTEITVKLDVGPGGGLSWLPQETILFDQARVRRHIDVALARDATLLLAEATVFGRSAMGETVASGSFHDRWRVRVGGSLVFAETVRLDEVIAQQMAERAVAAGGAAIATVLIIPGNEQDVAAVQAIQEQAIGEIGVSAWNGIALIRFVARNGAALRHDLTAVLTALKPDALPRLWLN